MKIEFESDPSHQDEYIKGISFQTVKHSEDYVWIQIGNQEVMILKEELKRALTAILL